MGEATRGDPELLTTYTQEMTAQVAATRPAVHGYAAALERLLSAASELPVALPVRSARIDGGLDDLARLDRQPARFAAALRAADRLPMHPGAPLLGSLLAGLRQGLREPDLAEELARTRQGDDTAMHLLALLDADLDDRGRELAAVLDQLDVHDPTMVAAFYETLGADGLVRVLAMIAGTMDIYEVEHDAAALAALLEPLGVSFAAAARLGVVDEAFVEQLLIGTTAGNRGGGATTVAVAQLLIYGDPMRAGNPALTAGLASMVLADGFVEATWWMRQSNSPWQREEGDPFADGFFHIEAQVARAAGALADHPASAYRFLLASGNQRALLDRAGEGWWLGSAEGASRLLEAGLLRHPLDTGSFDDTTSVRARAELTMATRALITEVAGRSGVDASVTRGLANLLAPHGDSIGRAVSRNGLGDDLLQLDRSVVQAYLANVMRHEPGGVALNGVFSGWTSETLARWSEKLVPASGVVLGSVHADYTLDLTVIRDLYTLYEHALADAGQRYADDKRMMYLAVDEADRAARSGLLRELGWAGGPKGRLASEALSRTTALGTDRLKGLIEAAGPGTVEDLQAELHDRLPNLTIEAALAATPPERMQELVPVAADPRPVDVDAPLLDRWIPWRDDQVPELRDATDWDAAARNAWITENMARIASEHGLTDAEARQWWINVHVSNVEDRFTAPRP